MICHLAANASRRAKRQQLSNGEILTTFLAYKLDHVTDKMALGPTIGDPLTLLHEPEINGFQCGDGVLAGEVDWLFTEGHGCIGAAEVPEAVTGLEAVVTG